MRVLANSFPVVLDLVEDLEALVDFRIHVARLDGLLDGGLIHFEELHDVVVKVVADLQHLLLSFYKLMLQGFLGRLLQYGLRSQLVEYAMTSHRLRHNSRLCLQRLRVVILVHDWAVYSDSFVENRRLLRNASFVNHHFRRGDRNYIRRVIRLAA